MNVFTNEAYVSEQRRRARRMRLIGVLCIFLSFLMSFGFGISYYLVYLAYPLLIAGLPLWTIGRAAQRRFDDNPKDPREDKSLDVELKPLNNKYALYHYVPVEGRVISHLLVSPAGLIVIEASKATGPITCTSAKGKDKWKSPAGFLDRISGTRTPVGNPTKELEASLQAARAFMAKSAKPDSYVDGLIVFTLNPDVEAEGCTYEAIPLNELRQVVMAFQYEVESEAREEGKLDIILTSDDRRRINTLLRPAGETPPVKPKPSQTRKEPVTRR